MYGVSKISSEQNIMLTTFPGAQYSAQSLAEHLDVFANDLPECAPQHGGRFQLYYQL